MTDLPEHVQRNREEWDSWAEEYVETGERNWAADEASWGIWNVPESKLGLFADVEAGMDAIELGCGTGYVSAWLARRGLKPVGIDNSEAQLATAKRLQAEHGIDFPLMHGNAEQVPLPDASFDLAISEYGASIWCDPYEWIPEAARLLRPGGQLVFLVNSLLMMLCVPDEVDVAASEKLVRPMFGLHRMEWSDDASVEFHLPHGEMISLLRSSGFEVEALLEFQAPEDSRSRWNLASLEWARRWPCEEVWKARKCG
jgi:ubiquinone/menaquinone biosynthesis C-methylase UbiE